MSTRQKRHKHVETSIDFDPFDLRLPDGYKFKKGYEVPRNQIYKQPIAHQGAKLYKFGISDYTDIPQLVPYATRREYLVALWERASYYMYLNRKRDAFAKKYPKATLAMVDKACPDNYPFDTNFYKRQLFTRISIDPRYMYLPLKARMALAGFKTAITVGTWANKRTWFNPETGTIEKKAGTNAKYIKESYLDAIKWYNKTMSEHILPAMREERARVLNAMKTRDLSTVEYHRLVGALDVLNKNVNLGEGLPTANVSVVDQLSDAELAAMIASADADTSVSGDPAPESAEVAKE